MDEKTQKLAAIDKDLENVKKQSAGLSVSNEDGKIFAVNFLGEIKSRMKRIETLRKIHVQPLNDEVKTINNQFRIPLDKFKKVESDVKDMIKTYIDEQYRLAREEYEKKKKIEQERQEKIEEERKKLEQEASKAKNEEEKKRLQEEIKNKEEQAKITIPVEVKQPEQQTRTEGGLMSVKKVWKFEIVDARKVPNKYLIIDEAAIRKDIKQNGEREIAGVRIFQDSNISIR